MVSCLHPKFKDKEYFDFIRINVTGFHAGAKLETLIIFSMLFKFDFLLREKMHLLRSGFIGLKQ